MFVYLRTLFDSIQWQIRIIHLNKSILHALQKQWGILRALLFSNFLLSRRSAILEIFTRNYLLQKRRYRSI